MPRQKTYTTIGMRERQIQNWHKRVKQGDAYELKGAYGDAVFVPRVVSDVDPMGARHKNRMGLKKVRDLIEQHKKNPVEGYVVKPG